MFQVEHYKTDNSLKWLVKQFEVFRFDDEFIAEKFVPRPDISIIFHFEDTPFISGDIDIKLEPFFATPIVRNSFIMDFRGNLDTFIVICKPTVFSRIFDIDLSLIKKQSIDLPSTIFLPLWQSMARLQTVEERIQEFTTFINKSHPLPYVPDAVDELYEKILEQSVKVPIKDIMQNCPACKRTLERKFIKRTGVTAKTLMRIVRMNSIWTRINCGNTVDYQELIFDGHYFDQAHFIKDFQSIIGESPRFFFHRNLKVVKMFSGIIPDKI